ncbi:cytochrome P450 [Xylariaceae sp. FL0662B]|nr:cytochrome P450 [Xylariaceae sp. FL0662B]
MRKQGATHAQSAEDLIRSPVSLGDGITAVEGEKWAACRKLIKPSFDVVYIGKLENRNLGTAFGCSAVSRPAQRAPRTLDVYFYARQGAAVRLTLMSKLRFLHRDSKWRSGSDVVNDFLDKRVDEALAHREKGEPMGIGESYDRLHLVNEMAKATQGRVTLRFQMHNVFTSANEEAAITLSNVFSHLSRCSTTKGLPITYDLLKGYRFVKKVIRETHRGTPISTSISCQCIKNVVLPSAGGKDGTAPLYLEKGDIVVMNIWYKLRDEAF